MNKFNKVFIVAEAGCNHNGKMGIAKRLINSAKACGADAIKFQIFRTENIISSVAAKSAHWKNIKKEDSVFMAMKKLEFNQADYAKLKNTARDKGVIFFASVFDIDSLRLAREINVPIIKIPSGEIVNLELLHSAAKLGKPIILSTGMSGIREVRRAVNIIRKGLKIDRRSSSQLIARYPFFRKGLVLMHTVSTYPSALAELNLKAISTLKSTFGLPVGYSDHSLGDEPCLIAVALGAELIEKHFTLDRNMDGFDHKVSLEPGALKKLITKINNVQEMLGDGIKGCSASERRTISLFRKSIISGRDIKKGEIIDRKMLDIKRPLDGIGCENIKQVLGLKTKTDIGAGLSLKWEDLF